MLAELHVAASVSGSCYCAYWIIVSLPYLTHTHTYIHIHIHMHMHMHMHTNTQLESYRCVNMVLSLMYTWV